MCRRAALVFFVVVAIVAPFLAGCAASVRPHAAVVAAPAPPPVPATLPSGPQFLELDAIEPCPILANLRPASQPTTRAPIDALLLYARARDAMAENRRAEGITLLQQASVIDPDSYELHLALGRAYKAGLSYDPRSIAELEKAAAIDPDHLEVQADLGRQYLSRGDAAKGLWHLRLAQQTKEYKASGNPPRALEVDLFLAHALQGLGYDRAAMGQFERVLQRLAERGPPRGANSDVTFQIANKLYQQLGDLYLKQGLPARALDAYERAGLDPDDFDLQARIVRVLLVLDRPQEAATRAAYAVSRFRASSDSVVLLREVYRAVGREADAANELAKLHAQKPADRAILFALADVLRTDGRWREADGLLARAGEESPADGEIVRRRAALYESAGELAGAARLLIDATARQPDLAGELQEPWARLLRTENRRRLSLADLQALDVPPAARAAHAYAVAHAARLWPRRAVAQAALNEALNARPPFAPAFRQRNEEIWNDAGLGPESRSRAALALADVAASAGAASLAAELRGRALLQQGDVAGGAAALAEAVKLNGVAPAELPPAVDPTTGSGSQGTHEGAIGAPAPSSPAPPTPAAPAIAVAGSPATTVGIPTTTPAAAANAPATGPATPRAADGAAPAAGVPPDLHLAFAASLLAFDNAPSFERLMWKLIGDHPGFTAGYEALHDYYWGKEATEQAERVVTAWRRAEPLGLAARLTQARDQLRLGRLETADVLLGGLFEEFSDDPGVLSVIHALYSQTGRSAAWLTRLEDRLSREPRSFNVAARLAHTYAANGRLGDAVRVLDATRIAAADEPDVLYNLSLLYSLAQQKQTAEDLLQQVLKLDPGNPSANNDLGYTWAEQGRDLERAEALTRTAVNAQPENPSLLDSLGWVLYKRGRFQESRDVFERAIGKAEPATPKDDIADPVVLDHMGDVLYRLGDVEAAGKLSKRTRQRLAALGDTTSREDLKPLGLQLQQKQKQLKAGQPVSVAPVIESPAGPATKPAQAGLGSGPGGGTSER